MEIPKIERIFQGFALTALMIFGAIVVGLSVIIVTALLIQESPQRESVKVVNGTNFHVDTTLVTESFDSSEQGQDFAALQVGDSFSSGSFRGYSLQPEADMTTFVTFEDETKVIFVARHINSGEVIMIERFDKEQLEDLRWIVRVEDRR